MKTKKANKNKETDIYGRGKKNKTDKKWRQGNDNKNNKLLSIHTD